MLSAGRIPGEYLVQGNVLGPPIPDGRPTASYHSQHVLKACLTCLYSYRYRDAGGRALIPFKAQYAPRTSQGSSGFLGKTVQSEDIEPFGPRLLPHTLDTPHSSYSPLVHDREPVAD